MYRGWRDKLTRLWRFDLTSKGGRITPETDPSEYDHSKGMVLFAIDEQELHYFASSIYKCNNKEHLITYMYASLGSHPKTTLIAASNAGYHKGCPGMTAPSIIKFITIEDATKMGHMKQL